MKNLITAFRKIVLSSITFLLISCLYSQSSMETITRIEIPPGEGFMTSLDGEAGDLNGDGVQDIVFGRTDSSHQDCRNLIYIYHSIPDSTSTPDQIITSYFPEYSATGELLSYAGDLNGDGYDDLVVCVPWYGPDTEGAVAIYWGGPVLSPNPDMLLVGSSYESGWPRHFGLKVKINCDVNGDGYNDLLVYNDGPEMDNYGNIFGFYGGPNFDDILDFHIRGTNASEYLGRGFATGDLNGDGFDELILYRYLNYTNGYMFADIYLSVYQIGNVPSPVMVYNTWLENIPTDNGQIMYLSIDANGDLNGDNFDDIIFTSVSDPNPSSTIHIFYGCPDLANLSETQIPFHNNTGFYIYYYCDSNHDQYSDICGLTYQNSYPDWTIQVFEQSSQIFDINPEYFYNYEGTGEMLRPLYSLNDYNHDGYIEHVVASNSMSQTFSDYLKVVTNHYVANQDETIPHPDLSVTCYPNPFSDKVTFKFGDSQCSNSIRIYNVKGQLIKEIQSIEKSEVVWDGKDEKGKSVSAGVYFTRLISDGKSLTTKMLMLK